MAADEDLSWEQIHGLLQEEEARRRKLVETEAPAQEQQSNYSFPKLDSGGIENAAHIKQGKDGVARLDKSVLTAKDSQLADYGKRKIDDPLSAKQRKEEKHATAGADWFNLPKTDLANPAVKKDLQILGMRSVLDPHRHYKKDKKLGQAEYSQIGEIIEGPTEFFSGRINKKDRKRTFVEEVLAGEMESGRFKRKYSEIQTSKTSGKKAFYKALKAKRSKR